MQWPANKKKRLWYFLLAVGTGIKLGGWKRACQALLYDKQNSRGQVSCFQQDFDATLRLYIHPEYSGIFFPKWLLTLSYRILSVSLLIVLLSFSWGCTYMLTSARDCGISRHGVFCCLTIHRSAAYCQTGYTCWKETDSHIEAQCDWLAVVFSAFREQGF